jgi:hypothetical protein
MHLGILLVCFFSHPLKLNLRREPMEHTSRNAQTSGMSGVKTKRRICRRHFVGHVIYLTRMAIYSQR